MKRLSLAAACAVGIMLLSQPICEAASLGAGKYCGVVVFDRWGGCTLYSGVYVMYISEKVKDTLRQFAGQAVQIDVTKVQPTAPGDGFIVEFKYLGPAPKRNWLQLDGLLLRSSVSVSKEEKAVATITIENRGKEPVKLFSEELALTLLMKCPRALREGEPIDGPSFALMTRQSFYGMEATWHGGGGAYGLNWSWTIGKENALPHDFILAPGEKKQIVVNLSLPDGEYDCLSGYGGGAFADRCLASNLSAFDVVDGKAKLVEVKGR